MWRTAMRKVRRASSSGSLTARTTETDEASSIASGTGSANVHGGAWDQLRRTSVNPRVNGPVVPLAQTRAEVRPCAIRTRSLTTSTSQAATTAETDTSAV